jgi:hypothetical protein
MKKSQKRLTLRIETVRALAAAHIGDVAGAKPIIIRTLTCEILKCLPPLTDRSQCDLCVAG